MSMITTKPSLRICEVDDAVHSELRVNRASNVLPIDRQALRVFRGQSRVILSAKDALFRLLDLPL
jgi:hypothetical protein